MSKRYDEAAKEARAHLKEVGQRDLAAAQKRYPKGTWVLAESDGLVRWGRVQGHELNMRYRPIVLVSGNSFYPHEIVRVIDPPEADLLDGVRPTSAAEAVAAIDEYWQSIEDEPRHECDEDCELCH